MECLMGGCSARGEPNYMCSVCAERKLFCCEGCEIHLLNDLRVLGEVGVCCPEHRPTEKMEDRVKEINVPNLLKRSEQLREKMVSDQRFEDSVVLRDLAILVRSFGKRKTKK